MVGDYEILERIIEGQFPLDNVPDHKGLLSHEFFRNLEDAGIEIEKVLRGEILENPIARIFCLKRYFTWIPFKDQDLKPYRKSSKTACLLREVGRAAIAKRNLKEALKYYNLAVVFAPIVFKEDGSLEEGKSKVHIETLADRADILLQVRGGEEALRDANYVLGLLERAENYATIPSEMVQKFTGRLKETQTKCLKFLDEKACFMMELGRESVEEMERRLKYKSLLLFKVKRPHALMPAAESFVDIKVEPGKGRCLLVNRDIPAGTTVVVEDPFVKVLKDGLKWDLGHCHLCLTKMRGGGGIPCLGCVFETYCSEKCRDTAAAKYHRWECPIMSYLHFTSTPRYVQLALRIVCTLGPKEAYRLFITKDPKYFGKNKEEGVRVLGCTPGPGGIYDSDSYLPIHHLVSHPPRNTVEVLTNTLQALLFSHVLDTLSGFFQQPKYLETHPRAYFLTFISAIILHHIENIPSNSISVDELEGLEGVSLLVKEPTILQERIRGLKRPQVASAVYALSSLLNHSCDPNVTRVHDLTYGRMALVTLKGMKEGEELLTSYTKIFLSDSTEERREYLLSTYNFTCDCIPCAQKWPILAKISETEPRFLCAPCMKKLSGEEKRGTTLLTRCILDKKGNCRNCRKVATPLPTLRDQLDQRIEGFFEAYELILKNKPFEAIRLLGPCAQFFQDNVCPPYNKIYMSQDLLKTALDLVVHYSVPRT